MALLPAGEILSKALAAASSAESFHVKGDLKIDGDTLALDLVVSGRNGKGSITAQGRVVELVRVSAWRLLQGGRRLLEPGRRR